MLKQRPRTFYIDRTGFSAGGRIPYVARLRFGMANWPCRIGRSGIRHDKREGDGATPAAILRPVRGFWRADRRLRPRTALPMQPLRPGDGWCETPGDRAYNRLVKKPYRASHEDMMRSDALYDVVVELDWNRVPRRQGRGSAIFLHLTRPELGPTAGCLALPKASLDRLLARLDRHSRFVIR
jgi:L,D-peptidoglycan transpeptidase YkuD (ErfK/YbiS/YcfS/YnhG family)